MSGLVGGAQTGNNPGAQDLRLVQPGFDPAWALFRECIHAVAPASFRSEWWPGSLFVGDLAADVGVLDGDTWTSPDPAGGASSRYGVGGVTRDAYGSILGSVTVKLFRTVDDLKLDQGVSDPTTGAYLLNTPYYPDQHYLVFYKAGSPDVFGSSANTLIGS